MKYPKFNPQPKKNKYGAKKQLAGGRVYDSTLEKKKADDLEWMRRAGEIRSWKAQHCFALRVNGTMIGNYYIDFRVVGLDNVIDYIEVKGFPTDLWRLKFRLTQALFDELTPGENARLFLNNKLICQSFKAQPK